MTKRVLDHDTIHVTESKSSIASDATSYQNLEMISGGHDPFLEPLPDDIVFHEILRFPPPSSPSSPPLLTI